jgi:hypothetical protein
MAASVSYTNFGGELVADDPGGVTSYYVPDNLGSTVSWLDSIGSITDTFAYWPYGEIRRGIDYSNRWFPRRRRL